MLGWLACGLGRKGRLKSMVVGELLSGSEEADFRK